ncbi:pyruvate formate lyase family protein [Actinacidiphila bryophytorum]|uniref:pyruvate formate lyase family protein n=1 Tax=Actinacidiphila bryophytorum TaxID=1436133 RepID=UPI001960C94A|nr:pyruvate formate lyase family protein [Actinacidiphila bryophytorum]MBM9438428.1 universal stress protein [Actinacidiphila bryophytorum]MBN6542298.1 universal stress protein [Actinacidiphila bryophytorum]
MDGSNGGREAARWAAEEAEARGLALRLVTVVPPELSRVPSGAGSGGWGRPASGPAEVLGDITLAYPDLDAAAREITGRPSEVLPGAVRGAELVVVGTRGAGGFEGLRLGSVALAVAGRAPCPVVLVPPPATSGGCRHEVVVGVDARHPDQGALDVAFEEAALRSALLRAVHAWDLPVLYQGTAFGRIIGDYRRVALYGTARLVEAKRAERARLDLEPSTAEVIRDREELAEQIRALGELARMAASYGCDVTRPAATAHEAVQWLYLGYLAAVKEQNGAAMSLGRTSTFLDVYLQRDLDTGVVDETRAQELIDDFVIKLRIVRFLRTPEYDALFSGDPTWVTESIGGLGTDGRTLVTRTSFRFLQTLYNLGPAPEPNLTVLWSPRLPGGFKQFCAQVSIDTSAIQYESDDLMRPRTGDDTAIACCVSAMAVGRQMQFFGARVNLAKALLYAVNGGRDEITGEQVAPAADPLKGDYLDYDELSAAYDRTLDWLAATYVNALNVIHFMHDKYAYERLEMALHDHPVHRFLACGIAGLSVAADSLSAVKYGRVRVRRDDTGLAVGYETRGEWPAYGNNDDRADTLATDLVESFMAKIAAHPSYRDAEHTQSVLTITSNVVYGLHTGGTPDGRPAGAPFAPGANPMNGRDRHGMIASAMSVAKIPYAQARDGISLTSTITPEGLGHDPDERAANLLGILDAYTATGGFHLNVNVLDRATLEDAMAHPDKYPELTIRVSGYAVNFIRLTREQQLDVISRTFHGAR